MHLVDRTSGTLNWPWTLPTFFLSAGCFAPSKPTVSVAPSAFCKWIGSRAPIRCQATTDKRPPVITKPSSIDRTNMKEVETPRTLSKDSTDEASTNELSAAGSEPVLWHRPVFFYILLNVVTVLWGTQHAVIKSSLTSFPDAPGLLNFSRFTLAALSFCYWTPSAFKKDNQAIWKAGIELGWWMFLGYALQAVGLQFTSASRSGFLLYLNVKLVPLFAWVLLSRRPTLDVITSAIVAFLGTALLSFDGSPPNIGDLWCVLAAAASAMFILRLEGAAQTFSARSRELNSATLWVTSAFCLLWTGFELGTSSLHPLGSDEAWVEAGPTLENLLRTCGLNIVFLGLVTTALCNWLQTIGQREVPAERAALIYALDPVYGAIFARLILGQSEALGVTGYVGAALITGAALFASLAGTKGMGTEGGGGKERVGLKVEEGEEGELELGQRESDR